MAVNLIEKAFRLQMEYWGSRGNEYRKLNRTEKYSCMTIFCCCSDSIEEALTILPVSLSPAHYHLLVWDKRLTPELFSLAAPPRMFALGLREIYLRLCLSPFLQFPIIVWKCFPLIFDPVKTTLKFGASIVNPFNCFCFKSLISFKGKKWQNLITDWGMFCTVSELEEKKTLIQVELRTAKAYLTSWIEVR